MIKTISTEELKQRLDGGDEKLYLVDVLDEGSFDAQHIHKSLNLPYDLYFIDRFSKEITPDKNAEIVIYCASEQCKTSVLAAELLEKSGYANVFHYAEGLAGWQKAGYAFEKSL